MTKKPPRRPSNFALACLAVAVVAMSAAAWLRLSQEAPEWPHSAINSAESVSLSRLRAEIDADGTGRRVAILPDRILLEMAPGAGDPQDDTAEDPAAEDPAAAEDETASDAAEGAETAADTEADVISADIPYPNSPFMNDLIREDLLTSSFEVEVFDDQGGLSPIQYVSVAMQGLLIAIILFVLVRMTGMGSGTFGTENGFEVVKRKDLTVGLEDVAGLESARQGIEEVISLLKNEGAAAMAGGRLPRGLLLDGPPGTGKTHLTRAMAKEAGVSFISVDASSLNQMFVGLGSMKVRRIFRRARKEAPCIVFIDEIDAMGRSRGNDGGGAAREGDNTLNALLTELDGFEARSGIFVVAATNRSEILDPALTRPGRIDRKITMTLPDINAREEILQVKTRKMILAPDVDLRAIAATAFQSSGADLENLANEAALAAGRDGRKIVEMRDFTRARDRLLLPESGGSIALLEDEREITAIHEAGHAVVALLSPHADPVEKVTITPQGAAMGFVLQSPDRDRVFETRARLEARLAVMAAGRMAEQLAYGADMITTGAASDIQQATAVARAMVTRYGMSDFGFVLVDPNDAALFDVNNPPAKMISDITAAGMDRARQVLEENLEGLHRLAVALLEAETLSGEEARAIVTGETASCATTGHRLFPARETERRMRLPRLSRSA